MNPLPDDSARTRDVYERMDRPPMSRFEHGESRNGEYDSRVRRALEHLERAAELARVHDRDVWQFAVELADLLAMDLTRLDIRSMMCQELILHAYEVDPEDRRRRFAPEQTGLIRAESCFVLASGGAREAPQFDAESRAVKPAWSQDERTLSYCGRIVKRFRCPALNQETILAVFEEEDWPNHIHDPLPAVEECDAKQRLHDTIRRLNTNQQTPLLRFRGDGTGEGVLWEVRGE